MLRPKMRKSKKRSKRRLKRSSAEIHKQGLVKEVMRNIKFRLNIEVADVASPTPYVKETLESITASPIGLLIDDRQMPGWVTCTEEYRKRVGFIGNSITLLNVRRTGDGRLATLTRRTYTSKHQKNYFTVEEIVDIVVKFERLDRPKSRIVHDGKIERDFITFDGMRRHHDRDGHYYTMYWD